MQFKIKDTKIIISFTFFALVLLLNIFKKTEFLYISIFSAILHEIGHLVALKIFGAEITEFRISLFDCNIKSNKNNKISYYEEILISFLGPFTNLFLSVFLFVVNFNFDNELVKNIIIMNLVMGLFNLLPFNSFDGGKIIKLLIENKFNERIADFTVSIVSFVVLIPFSYVAFLNFLNSDNDFYLLIVSVFMFLTIILKK